MWRRVSDGYWLIPAVCVVAAGVAALLLVRMDEHLQRRGSLLAFGGGPDSARALLSTVSTSMLSLTALTFSITMVVLQLASSQFSPRAIPTFLRDRQNQLTLGVFLATYVYALLALREIRGTDAVVEQFIPGLTIGLAFLLVLLSIGFFVAYIHHVATSIQVGFILQRIERETRLAMSREYGQDTVEETRGDAQGPRPGVPCRTVAAPRRGVVAGIDVSHLVREASARGVIVRLLVRPGDFLPEGAPLLVVEGEDRPDDAWSPQVAWVGRRDEHHDVTFGLRQLVDIAERALSPGVNDPSTASQCLDHLHSLLRTLATSAYPRQVHFDGDRRPRLITPQVPWADHVAMVLDEIRLWGSASLQVRDRLQRMVDDLLTVAPAARRQPLLERLPLFDEPLPLGSATAPGS